MKFLKKCLPVMFAVILAVSVMIFPAFAASAGSGAVYSGTGYYEETDGWVYLSPDHFNFVDGQSYIVTINGESFEVVASVVSCGIADCLHAPGECDYRMKMNCGSFSIEHTGMGLMITGDVSHLDGCTVAIAPVVPGERGLSDLLDDAGDVVTSLTGWVGSVARLVLNTPVLLIGFTIALATLAFGIFKSLKR